MYQGKHDRALPVPYYPTSMDSLSQQRLSSVLSASYSDAEIRNALQVLDSRFTHNSPDFRRQLRVDVQAEVIHSNTHIVREFSKISKVLAMPKPEVVFFVRPEGYFLSCFWRRLK